MTAHAHVWLRAGSLSMLDADRQGVVCERPRLLVCTVEGCDSRVAVACRSSRSSVCGPCGAAYRARVARVASSGVVVSSSGLFITLTAPGVGGCASWCTCTPAGFDLAAWNASSRERWSNFRRDLRRYFGDDVQRVVHDRRGWDRRYSVRSEARLAWFKAVEVQDRGALHFHVLVRRVGGGKMSISRSALRRLAIRHGFGHSVDVQPLQPGHALYVAKYVSKAVDQRRRVPWPRREVPAGAAALRAGDPRRPGVLSSRWTVCRPSYRSWTCSRGRDAWGRSMAGVSADQRHYAAVLWALPDWHGGALSDLLLAALRLPDVPI